jgi:hypothetical protein
MAWPERIIVSDDDGGFYIAELDRTMCVTGDDADIPVYTCKEYYHSLTSAARDMGLKAGTIMKIEYGKKEK